MLRSEAIAPAPIIECSGVVIVAYSPSRGAQVARKASVAVRCTRCGSLHLLWGAAPEQKGCNANGSGVLLLVLRLLWWHVALRCRPLLPLECCVAVCLLWFAAPVAGRCTRYVALHPLWGAAPEQKGCNADGSGVAQSRTRKGAVSVGESVSNCDEDRNAMRGFHSPSLVLSVIHSG